MKLFDNIQNVWEYCNKCPICQSNCKASIVVYADYLKMIGYEKEGNALHIHLVYDQTKRKVSISIDCNTHIILAQDIYDEKFEELYEDRLFLTFHGSCDQCKRFQINSNEILIDLMKNYIDSDNSIQRESFYLSCMEDNFHVSLLYYNSTMIVSRYIENKSGEFITTGNVFYGKMVNCDLVNQSKIINKLKTLLIFS